MNRRFTNYDANGVATVTYQDFTWAQVRTYRDQILRDTDWRFMSDQSPSQEWIDYRQFLRDLPQNFFDVSDEVSQGANAAADAWNEYEIPEGAE